MAYPTLCSSSVSAPDPLQHRGCWLGWREEPADDLHRAQELHRTAGLVKATLFVGDCVMILDLRCGRSTILKVHQSDGSHGLVWRPRPGSTLSQMGVTCEPAARTSYGELGLVRREAEEALAGTCRL